MAKSSGWLVLKTWDFYFYPKNVTALSKLCPERLPAMSWIRLKTSGNPVFKTPGRYIYIYQLKWCSPLIPEKCSTVKERLYQHVDYSIWVHIYIYIYIYIYLFIYINLFYIIFILYYYIILFYFILFFIFILFIYINLFIYLYLFIYIYLYIFIMIFLQKKKCRSVFARGLDEDCERNQLKKAIWSDEDDAKQFFGLERPPGPEIQTGKEGRQWESLALTRRPLVKLRLGGGDRHGNRWDGATISPRRSLDEEKPF